MKGTASLLFVALVLCIAPYPGSAGAVTEGFIANQGQLAGPVRFYARGEAVSVYFTPTAIVFDLRERLPAAEGESGPGLDFPPPDEHPEPIGRGGCALWVRFTGANPSATIEARGELACRYHYFRGSDRQRWRTEVPAFAEIIYHDLWPGVDLVLRRTEGIFSYEVVGQPGAAPPGPGFAYDGAERVTRAENESYRIETSAGTLWDLRSGPEGTGGCFILDRDRQPTVAGPAGRDDPSTLLWSTFLGGDGEDYPLALALDPAGNPVVTGYTEVADFPTTPGSYDTSHNGGFDIFIAKLSPSNDGLLWSTFLGGSDYDYGYALARDQAGDFVLTGTTFSTDFPTTAAAYDTSFNGGSSDLFVAKLSSSGAELLWSTYLGGSSSGMAIALALDQAGNPVLTGNTYSTDFPTSPGAYDTSYHAYQDVFVAKLSASGSDLLWGTYLGGEGMECGYAIALDPAGNPVLTGFTDSADFPTTPGAFDTSMFGWDDDIFVAKLSASGTDLLWGTFLEGEDDERCYAVAIHPAGDPVLAGKTYSADFPITPGAYDTSHNGFGYEDIFVTRLAASGSTLVWSTFIGGESGDWAAALCLDPAGNVYVTGPTWSSDFPVTPEGYDTSRNGWNDAFLARLSFSGTTLLWSTFLGGSDGDSGAALALDPAGNPVLTGSTLSFDFPTTPGAFDTSYNGGGYDLFVSVLQVDDATAIPDPEVPSVHFLEQNHPNPFNPSTSIRFGVAEAGPVTLRIFDLGGRLIRTLIDKPLTPGKYSVAWDGRGGNGRKLPSGTYLIDLTANGTRESKKAVLIQ